MRRTCRTCLAVDRVTFAARVTEEISREPRIQVRREEVTKNDQGQTESPSLPQVH